MVSSISGGNGSYDTTSVQQLRSQAAARMLKAVDTNQDGVVTPRERLQYALTLYAARKKTQTGDQVSLYA